MRGKKIEIKEREQITELLKQEKDWEVWRRLAFLNAIANLGIEFEEATRIFLVPHPTAYEWIRKWNKERYDGIMSRKELRTGRPPRLNDENLEELKEALKEKEFWQTKEVVEIIRKRFGVELSEDQVRRILRDRLGMKLCKPYPKDYRRPKDAEEVLANQLELTYRYLTEVKDCKPDEIAIGFTDETSPQLTANTVRVWSFDKPEIKKNTQKMKANTVGFYALRGNSVYEFTVDSRIESFLSFLEKVKVENSQYKAIIMILDNFPTHKSTKVKEKAEEMGIYLVYLPPYSPDLNPIEFIWKSIKRVISVSFVKQIEELKQIIAYTFSTLSKSLSFAKSWIRKFFVRLIPSYGELCI